MKKYNKWVTLLLGYLGIHRYMAGEIGMGILYTCTGGLFGIGWIVDTVRAFMGGGFYIPIKKLPVVPPQGLVLHNGEICHYQGQAYAEKVKDRIAGYTSDYSGGSVRIAKGMSIRTGGSTRRAVRETVSERNYGILYITNERVVFLSEKNAFEKPFSLLTAFNPSVGGVVFQFGNTAYPLMTDDSNRIRDIVSGIINGMEVDY